MAVVTSSLYPFLFYLPILEHELVTFRAPLYLVCTLFTELFMPWGWQTSRVGILATWSGVSDVSLVVKLLSLLTMSSIIALFPWRTQAALPTLPKKIWTIESQFLGRMNQKIEHQKFFFSGFIGIQWSILWISSSNKRSKFQFCLDQIFLGKWFQCTIILFFCKGRGMRVIVKVPGGFFKKSNPFSFLSLNFHKALTHRTEVLEWMYHSNQIAAI